MNRTLFIIGNGFDRYLGIESSYQDFHNYMISQWTDGVILSNQLESLFPALDDKGCSLLWSDFEKAMGIMDRENVLDYCKRRKCVVQDEKTGKWGYRRYKDADLKYVKDTE